MNVETGLVMTNGVFDVIHRGHVENLKFAKSLGNKLVVAIDSDRRVKEIKGDSRPVNSQEDRKAVLEGIKYVDQVLVFDTHDELRSLYVILCPEFVVKGRELTEEQVREHDRIPQDIKIVLCPMVEGRSTTNIMRKIRSLSNCEKA